MHTTLLSGLHTWYFMLCTEVLQYFTIVISEWCLASEVLETRKHASPGCVLSCQLPAACPHGTLGTSQPPLLYFCPVTAPALHPWQGAGWDEMRVKERCVPQTVFLARAWGLPSLPQAGRAMLCSTGDLTRTSLLSTPMLIPMQKLPSLEVHRPAMHWDSRPLGRDLMCQLAERRILEGCELMLHY